MLRTSYTSASVYLYPSASRLTQLSEAQLCRARLSAGGLALYSTAFDKMGKDVESGRKLSKGVEIGHFLRTGKVVLFAAAGDEILTGRIASTPPAHLTQLQVCTCTHRRIHQHNCQGCSCAGRDACIGGLVMIRQLSTV